jgi:hypothetical protein
MVLGCNQLKNCSILALVPCSGGAAKHDDRRGSHHWAPRVGHQQVEPGPLICRCGRPFFFSSELICLFVHSPSLGILCSRHRGSDWWGCSCGVAAPARTRRAASRRCRIASAAASAATPRSRFACPPRKREKDEKRYR